MLNEKCIDFDNQSIISDITELTISSDSSEEFLQKKIEINKIFNCELNKLNMDALKEKCKENNIGILSKMKKQDVISILNNEFEKMWSIIQNKKIYELKNICKLLDIKGVNSLKKDSLCFQIMSFYANKVILNPEFESQKDTLTNQVILENQNLTIEELEKQKFEIEKRMIEAMEKQKLAELEKQKLAELEKQKLAELEKQKLAELEKQKLEQEEKSDCKKKKQSIPKNVRIIIWNHYIGEDIIKHKCLCCKKALISNTNFEVGHVTSEKNGGTHEINNLRPICFACNHSMGTENMIDFVVKYGLYIG
jgi:hypothetical protein